MEIRNVTVVVCTYNRAELLREALASLNYQDTDEEISYEILVIDDRSTDGTRDVVKEVAEHCRVPMRYVREEGLGIGHARNRGIAESSSEWIAFFDDDQLAEPNWLKELLESATETEAYCVGGARGLHLSADELAQLSPLCKAILGEIAGKEPVECGRKNLPCTGNVLIRRTVFSAVGKFDETLRLGGSDMDFFRRVHAAGIRTWYTPRAMVWHVIPAYRLKADYFIWRSLLSGNNFAQIDYKEWGLARTTLGCIARIGQAAVVNVPFLFWAYLLGNDKEQLARKCLLWRTVGFTRQTLHLLAPRLFPERSFLAHMEFRKEQATFQKDSTLVKRRQ